MAMEDGCRVLVTRGGRGEGGARGWMVIGGAANN
jgi:hypothetical protein